MKKLLFSKKKKKTRKFLKSKKDENKIRSPFVKKSLNEGDQQNSSTSTCFECNKPSHIKTNYFMYLRRILKNERKKWKKQLAKKVYLTT